MTTEAQVVSTTLGGRAVTDAQGDPTWHVFGQIASNAASISATLNDQRQECWGGGKNKGCRDSAFRLRRIRSSGIEIVREVAEPTSPLPITDIVARSRGCNRVSSFSLLINAETPAGFTDFRMDVGETLDIVASQVNYTICGPNGALVIGAPSPVRQLSGIISDGRIGVSVSQIEEDGGHRSVRFSELWRIPVNRQPFLPIPTFARELKVYMVQGATTSGPWATFASTTTNAIQEGILDFDASNTFSLDETRALGSSAFLRPDRNVQTDRIASLIWTIEP